MGYNYSLITLDKMRPHLRAVEAGQPAQWRVTKGEERKWAYKLREALAIAKHFNIQPLAKRADEYRIIATFGSGLVQMKRIRAINPVLIEHDELAAMPQPITEGSPTYDAEGSSEEVPDAELTMNGPTEEELDAEPISAQVHSVTISGQQSVFSIIDFAMKNGMGARLFFPEHGLSPMSLQRLYKWAKNTDPVQMLILSDEGLTVAPMESGMEEVEWRPDAEE